MELLRRWFLMISLLLVVIVKKNTDYSATGTFNWLENVIESVILVVIFRFFLW